MRKSLFATLFLAISMSLSACSFSVSSDGVQLSIGNNTESTEAETETVNSETEDSQSSEPTTVSESVAETADETEAESEAPENRLLAFAKESATGDRYEVSDTYTGYAPGGATDNMTVNVFLDDEHTQPAGSYSLSMIDTSQNTEIKSLDDLNGYIENLFETELSDYEYVKVPMTTDIAGLQMFMGTSGNSVIALYSVEYTNTNFLALIELDIEAEDETDLGNKLQALVEASTGFSKNLGAYDPDMEVSIGATDLNSEMKVTVGELSDSAAAETSGSDTEKFSTANGITLEPSDESSYYFDKTVREEGYNIYTDTTSDVYSGDIVVFQYDPSNTNYYKSFSDLKEETESIVNDTLTEFTFTTETVDTESGIELTCYVGEGKYTKLFAIAEAPDGTLISVDGSMYEDLSIGSGKALEELAKEILAEWF